jgi:hypothetical protein
MRIVLPPTAVLLAACAVCTFVGNLPVVSAWTPATTVRCTPNACAFRAAVRPLRAAPDDNSDEADEAAAASDVNDESPPSLVLGDGLGDEMAKLRSKYPTSEADYLAAARARNAAKMASTSHGNEEDWKKLAAEKKRSGELADDAWEASRQEAGNADSQILIPMMDTDTDSDDSEEPEEPKLLLW